jgi:hypothetical protein
MDLRQEQLLVSVVVKEDIAEGMIMNAFFVSLESIALKMRLRVMNVVLERLLVLEDRILVMIVRPGNTQNSQVRVFARFAELGSIHRVILEQLVA